MKHKHFDVIVAWADGACIEYFDTESWNWVDCVGEPPWNLDTEYRIKDKYPDDIVKFIHIPPFGSFLEEAYGIPNVKCVYDGETKKLKEIEMIKDKEW